MNDFNFKSLTEHPEGTIFSLLNRCYAGLDKMMPEHIKEWVDSWKVYDKEIFQNPHTIGACGFVTYLNDDIIGFASWDPRKYPTGLIGHNGILPEFRGNGYGRFQINEVINRFKKKNFQKASASTMDHHYFNGAQKMYLACGFKKTNRYSVEGKHYTILEYEKIL